MKFLIRLLLLASVVFIVVFLTLEFGLSQSARGEIYTRIDSLPYNKTALLLTTSKLDTGKNELLAYYQYRIDAAARLYRAGKVSLILVSGSNLDEKTVFLAKQDLAAMGVPPDHILMDTCGYTTYESIVRCQQLYDNNNITIISQQHHCERALYMARYTGLHAVGYVARGDGEKLVAGVIWHEFMGRVKMFWRLWTNQEPRYLHGCPIFK